jgi:hypothetical protein
LEKYCQKFFRDEKLNIKDSIKISYDGSDVDKSQKIAGTITYNNEYTACITNGTKASQDSGYYFDWQY